MRSNLMWLVICLTLLNGPAQAGEWRLALCFGQDATEDDLKYRHAIGAAAARVFSAIDPDAETLMQVRKCVREPDIACYADTSAIFCREEAFSQLVRIAAWLAAERALIYTMHQGAPETLVHSPSLTWTDAYLLAHADRSAVGDELNSVAERIMEQRKLSAEDLSAIYSLYLDIHRHVNNRLEAPPVNSELSTALAIYRASLDYAYGFLLGHEAFHYKGNKCHIQRDSLVKSTGVWEVIRDLQVKGGLYDRANRLDIGELRADHCGFKWLQQISSSADAEPGGVLNALARKTAIDLLASPLLIGLKGQVAKNLQGNPVPFVKVLPGYLYPQSRLALVSATLRLTESDYPQVVKLCGAVSKAMVAIIQDAVTNYAESSGMVPDELLAELPLGVERAWNGEDWTEQSHACDIGS